MRQIGVRDETRLQGGYATCGQELCCTRFGGQFEPVSIRMAKEQDLPLNSAKISGVCGRLMCCLRYEFEAYKDFKSRAPKKKTLIDTPLGKARIVEYNTPREQLVLRQENGKVFRVDLADMTSTEDKDFKSRAPKKKTLIDTPLGKARIVEYNTPREQLVLRLENGKVFRVDLADMTSTEENKQRCEAQGCSCRPDCVTRDVLERLESPELALALMELDRKNGVDVGDGLDTADRIVASGPTPRRKRMREEEAAKFEQGGSGRRRPGHGRSHRRLRSDAASQAHARGRGRQVRAGRLRPSWSQGRSLQGPFPGG